MIIIMLGAPGTGKGTVGNLLAQKLNIPHISSGEIFRSYINDAGEIGFRDDAIYDFIKGENKDLLDLKQMDRDECIKVFEEYNKMNGVIY